MYNFVTSKTQTLRNIDLINLRLLKFQNLKLVETQTPGTLELKTLISEDFRITIPYTLKHKNSCSLMDLELWYSVSWNLRVPEIEHCRERSIDLGVQFIQVHHFTDEETKACGGTGWGGLAQDHRTQGICTFCSIVYAQDSPLSVIPTSVPSWNFHPKVLDWSILGPPLSSLHLCLPSLPAQGEVWSSLHCVHGSPASSCFMWTWGSERGPGRPGRWVQWPWRTGFDRAKLPRSW